MVKGEYLKSITKDTLSATRKASISISSLQTDNFERTKEFDKDLEYIQTQINIIVENLELLMGAE